MIRWLRYIISALIVILFISIFFLLSHRLSYELIYQRASNHISNQHYNAAIKTLKKAIYLHSKDYRCWNKLGTAYYKTGSLKPLKNKFTYTLESKEAFKTASKLNPLDAEAFFGMAEAEARLERLHPFIHHGENPYTAAALYFHEAIRLRPNSTTYRYALIRHLHFTGKQEECLAAISALAKINPSILYRLKKETFWSVKIREAVKIGFQQAIKEKISLDSYYLSISRLLIEEKNWEEALFYYNKYLDQIGSPKDPEQYLHSGRLLLRTNQSKRAELTFMNALSISSNRKHTLSNILNIYAQTNGSEALQDFYKKAALNSLLPDGSNVLLAETLTRLGQYDQAKNILLQLSKEKPSAENHYWLARIAEKQNDWETMESAAREAVFMDDTNSEYHFLFSKILSRNKKLIQAEKELDLAIQYAKKSSYIFFAHRASIRTKRYNFKGAVEDWESAISLSPRNAKYYTYAAKAYLRLGEKGKAVNYYQKAIRLDPQNENYKKEYRKLKNTN